MLRFLAATLVVFGIGLRPDVMPSPAKRSGTGIAPTRSTSVVMSAETVTIALGADRASVEARFTLTNASDAEEKLEVGFPIEAHPEKLRVDGDRAIVETWRSPYSGLDAADGLAATIDGAIVKTELKVSTPDGKLAAFDENEGMSGDDKRYWHCWPMTFAPRAAREVVVTYTVGTEDKYYETWSPLRRRAFAYVLTTGSGWKDGIGSAKLIVRFDGISPRSVQDVVPKPTAREEKAWTWERKDWKPDTELWLRYTVFENAEDAVKKLEPVRRQSVLTRAETYDLACNLEALGRNDAAAEVWIDLHQFEVNVAQLGKPQEGDSGEHDAHFWRRPGAPYVCPAHRIAKLLRGSKDEAKWAAIALARLETLKKHLDEGFWTRKILRVDREDVDAWLTEARAWTSAK